MGQRNGMDITSEGRAIASWEYIHCEIKEELSFPGFFFWHLGPGELLGTFTGRLFTYISSEGRLRLRPAAWSSRKSGEKAAKSRAAAQQSCELDMSHLPADGTERRVKCQPRAGPQGTPQPGGLF